MRLLRGAMEVIRLRVLLRDGYKQCCTCKKVLPLNSFMPSRRVEKSESCNACHRKELRDYHVKHPDKRKEFAARRYDKIKKDPVQTLALRLRQRTSKAIKRHASGAAVSPGKIRYLGCTIEQARRYIEVQFKGCMSWENYGKAWHIDHVRPVASFDLTKESERQSAFHYTNLQPLWARTNMRKGARLFNKEHQPLLLL